MAVNYAEKYSNVVDERFTQQSITSQAVNSNYDWDGTSTVKVYSVGTSELNDYKKTGTNRYGEPDELGNGVQEMLLTQDKAFTFTIDRASYTDTQMVMEAGKALKREIDEVIVPFVDAYRLSVIVENAGATVTGAITKENAYEAFLDGVIALNAAKVPKQGRIAYVSPVFYKAIRLDENFIKPSEIAQNMLITGSLGMIEGVQLIDGVGLLPEGTNFVITHSIATTAVSKLQDYNLHENPPGINGWLVEGRVRFDAFVLNNKKGAIYAHKTTAAKTTSK